MYSNNIRDNIIPKIFCADDGNTMNNYYNNVSWDADKFIYSKKYKFPDNNIHCNYTSEQRV